MLETYFSDVEHRMKSAIDHTRQELAQIRTGRASPALLDSVKVPYYGSPTLLKSLANITVPEARLLLIQPFDKNLMYDIEKAIQAADLGLNPSNDGNVIRVPIPALNEERRMELVRLVHNLVEEGRIAIRNVRKDANNHIRDMERSHEISEDESLWAREEIQQFTDTYINQLNDLQEIKEKEIRED